MSFEPTTIMSMPVPHREITTLSLLADAVDRGASWEVIKGFMDLRDRETQFQAMQAFEAAYAKVKAELPVLFKNKLVGFAGKTGGRTSYKHVTYDEVVRVVTPLLAKHDMWFRVETDNPPGEPIVVTCVIGHAGGHKIKNTLRAARDESGNKNAIQGVMSTVTYLSRYTLMSIMGMAAGDDDDGRGGGTLINQEQLISLQQRIDESGINPDRFRKRFEIETIADLPEARLDEAIAAIAAYLKEKDKRGMS